MRLASGLEPLIFRRRDYEVFRRTSRTREWRNNFSVTPFLSERRYAAHNPSSNVALGCKPPFLITLFVWHCVSFRSAYIGLAFASSSCS